LEKKLLSIIIVNYNVKKYVERCILSIKKYLKNINYEIIVVDNDSTERDIESLVSVFNDVKFFMLKENLGFSAGNNYGFKKSESEFVLFLNPDTMLVDDCITPLIRYFSNNKIGVCAPMLVYDDYSFQFAFGYKIGLVIEIVDAFYVFIGLYERICTMIYNFKIKKNKPFKVGWISGAFMLMRSEIYRDIGGFDDNYKLNYEDMDLCMQINKKELDVMYFPNLKCIHTESKSQKKEFYNYIYHRYKGKLLYMNKYYNRFSRFIVLLNQLIGISLRILFSKYFFEINESEKRLIAFKDSFRLYLDFIFSKDIFRKFKYI
jgi:N-acetylglucosaminyl-diphospho-decaprenol L-rhamnosyltransferase